MANQGEYTTLEDAANAFVALREALWRIDPVAESGPGLQPILESLTNTIDVLERLPPEQRQMGFGPVPRDRVPWGGRDFTQIVELLVRYGYAFPPPPRPEVVLEEVLAVAAGDPEAGGIRAILKLLRSFLWRLHNLKEASQNDYSPHRVRIAIVNLLDVVTSSLLYILVSVVMEATFKLDPATTNLLSYCRDGLASRIGAWAGDLARNPRRQPNLAADFPDIISTAVKVLKVHHEGRPINRATANRLAQLLPPAFWDRVQYAFEDLERREERQEQEVLKGLIDSLTSYSAVAQWTSLERNFIVPPHLQLLFGARQSLLEVLRSMNNGLNVPDLSM